MTQFDPEWAIEEFHRQQKGAAKLSNLSPPSSTQKASLNTNDDRPPRVSKIEAPGGRRVAPTPPKRTSSYRDPSYQDKSETGGGGVGTGNESAQYESGVSLSAVDENSSTMDGLERMFQSLNQVRLPRDQNSPPAGNFPDKKSDQREIIGSRIPVKKLSLLYRQKSFESETGRRQHSQVTRSKSKILSSHAAT